VAGCGTVGVAVGTGTGVFVGTKTTVVFDGRGATVGAGVGVLVGAGVFVAGRRVGVLKGFADAIGTPVASVSQASAPAAQAAADNARRASKHESPRKMNQRAVAVTVLTVPYGPAFVKPKGYSSAGSSGASSRSTRSQITWAAAMWTSWMRGVSVEGTHRQ